MMIAPTARMSGDVQVALLNGHVFLPRTIHTKAARNADDHDGTRHLSC